VAREAPVRSHAAPLRLACHALAMAGGALRRVDLPALRHRIAWLLSLT
jgi:hypothetical protein